MPRLSTPLLHTARSSHPFLPLLLRAGLDLGSAKNELRWLREHRLLQASTPEHEQRLLRYAGEWIHRRKQSFTTVSYSSRRIRQRNLLLSRRKGVLYRWCVERSRGMPLQYILGSQPFGAVDVLCRRGVLIPRPETEAYTTRMASLILDLFEQITRIFSTRVLPTSSKNPPVPQLRILDLCTGTGCIPLLLHAILSTKVLRLEIVGVDISSTAIALAKRNLQHNVTKGLLSSVAKEQIRFVKVDIFEEKPVAEGDWDIVISNPPYISPQGFNKDTSRSVRNYEPRAALVPPESHADFFRNHGGDEDTSLIGDRDSLIGDAFYPKILEIANQARARLTLVEVADLDQAKRIASLGIRSGNWQNCEIWRDWPDDQPAFEINISGVSVGVLGEGNGRSVLFRREI